MAAEYSGRGDPQATLSLLWGLSRGPRPGPRPRLTPAEIGAVALQMADESGLEALSMRLLAQRMGVSTMALYRYVPGKPELLDLLLELAHAELPDDLVDADWPLRLRQVATDTWSLYLRHPWMLEISTYRASLGPHSLRKYERELRAVEGAGLSDLEMDLVVAAVSDHVRGAARSACEAAAAAQRTGKTDAQWWEMHAALLAQLVDPADFPLAVRVGAAAGAEYGATTDPARSFAFGLERLIEGLERHVRGA
jgi:AcrR family transcriptional regulator